MNGRSKSWAGHPISNTIKPLIVTVTVCLSFLLSGCGLLSSLTGKPPPPPEINIPVPLSEQPYSVAIKLTAQPNTNVDKSGNALPIRVLVFLNTPDVNITQKEFQDVFKSSDAAVEPLSTLTLQPGEERSIVIDSTRDHSVLAVAAAYRDPFQVVWIDELTINTEASNFIDVELRDVGVKLGLKGSS